MSTPRDFVERLLPLSILTLAIVAVPFLLASSEGLPRLDRLRKEQAAARERVSRLAAEIRQLRAEVEHAKSNPAYTERVARDELGLIRQTEVVFQFQTP